LHHLLVISKLSMSLCSMVYRQEWAKTVKRVKVGDEKFVLHILFSISVLFACVCCIGVQKRWFFMHSKQMDCTYKGNDNES